MEHSAPAAWVSADLDEIIEWYAKHAHVKLSASSPAFAAPGLHLDDRSVGRIRVARSQIPADLTLTTTSTEVYAVATVHRGSLHVDEAPGRWRITPEVAGIYGPVRAPRRNHVLPHTDMTYLQIRRDDLERQLEGLIDQYIPGPVDFRPSLPTGGEPAWLRLFRVFTDVFDDLRSALHSPLITRPLSEAMITTLLYAADNPYRELLRRPVRPARPRHVRVAIDAIRSEPERPYTVASLAALSGVSVCSLQQGFREHLGMSPLAYLRRVRLHRVHDQLERGEGATVAEAAHRWGFTHLGRFAAAYADVYGVAPSVTRSAAR
ncbi:helix-turn-helix transcriptional regulator [Actinoplanes sp. NPDC026619]|uniref:helix-turn-helix transcriptional regulator n=1 Tax=Actinoplanes sp. NPDC026619 TaxID=3155798 RepID=UPI0033D38E72